MNWPASAGFWCTVNAEFFRTPSLWPPWLYVFGAAALVQLAKFILYSSVRRRPDFRAIVSSNGLPSLHAVVLGCLATIIWEKYGAQDPAYDAVLIYGGIILHDAMKVKGRVDQGQRMALLLAEGFQRHFVHALRWREVLLPLSSRRSHRPTHVFIGVVLGIALGLLYR